METVEKLEYMKRIASLESKLDLMETELRLLNEKLLECGFEEGIRTLLQTIEEIEQETRDEE
jgi:hypothetical protein